MPTVSVVIPALNEARNLPHVLPHLPPDVAEVILVDGASVDGTIEAARELLPSVRIIVEPRRGKGTALWSGFQAATGDIIVMLDADGSTDPREIPAFVAALVAGADYAKGSRFLPPGGTSDMTRLRALGNRGFVILVRLLFGARYTDLCYGYNAFWRRVLPELRSDCRGFEVETVLNLRAAAARLQVTEVPSFESRRIYGSSNLRTFRDGWAVLKTIFRERFAARPQPARAGGSTAGRATSQPIVVSAIASGLLDATFAPLGPTAEPGTQREPGARPLPGAIPIEPDPFVAVAMMPADQEIAPVRAMELIAAVVGADESDGPAAPAGADPSLATAYLVEMDRPRPVEGPAAAAFSPPGRDDRPSQPSQAWRARRRASRRTRFSSDKANTTS